MYYGAGQLVIATRELDVNSIRGENLMLPGCIASFELSYEDNFIEAKCLVDGTRQTVASQITESIANMNLVFEVQDWVTTQLIYDEIATAITSVDLPELRVQNSDGSGVINDLDFLAADVVNEDVYFYAAQSRKFVTASQVTMGAGTATIAAYPNETIQYMVFVNHTSGESLGVSPQFDRFGRVLFSGRAYTTETTPNDATQILANQMSRIASPSLTINGDLNEISIDYRPELAAGKRRTIEFYNLSA